MYALKQSCFYAIKMYFTKHGILTQFSKFR